MRIQVRRGTSVNWGLVNPILASGEIGFETNTRRFKLGDGTTTYAELEFGAQFVSEKNQPGGYAGVGDDGHIPNSLIDFPDIPGDTNCQPFVSAGNFPSPGAASQLYLAIDTGTLYRWDGDSYEQVAKAPDASPTVKGLVQLTGDLGGAAELPLVKKINGVTMPTTAPEPGQVIKAVTSSTSTWSNDLVGGGGGGGGGDDSRFAVFEQNIGDGTSNPITVTHMMGTRQIHASMTKLKGDCEVISIFRMKAPSINAVIIEPDMILESGSWRLTLIGSLGLSDVTPPIAPTVTYISDTISTITVSATSSDPDEAGFNWFIKPTVDAGDPVYAGTSLGSEPFTFTGLLGLTEYTIAASALDSAGNESVLSDTIEHTTPVPLAFSYSSFTSIPVGSLQVPLTADAGPVAVYDTDKLRETAPVAGFIQNYSMLVLPDDVHTFNFSAEAVNAGAGGNTNRGVGVGLCNADGSEAVIAFAVGSGQGVTGRIFSWKDGVLTSQATHSGFTWNGGQTVKLVPSVDGGGVVTWGVGRNGVALGINWTDDGHLIDLPGTHVCLMFMRIRTSGVNYYSPGIASAAGTPI